MQFMITIHLITKTGQKLELEERVDQLRSILAQLEFSHTIRTYDRNGVPFISHLHVPEVHPLTGHTWYEREDPAHVLKVNIHTCQLQSHYRNIRAYNNYTHMRIATCTREGGPEGIKPEKYVEALKLASPTALVGMRKQSVQDAERMFSLPLADFMDEKGYTE